MNWWGKMLTLLTGLLLGVAAAAMVDYLIRRSWGK